MPASGVGRVDAKPPSLRGGYRSGPCDLLPVRELHCPAKREPRRHRAGDGPDRRLARWGAMRFRGWPDRRHRDVCTRGSRRRVDARTDTCRSCPVSRLGGRRRGSTGDRRHGVHARAARDKQLSLERRLHEAERQVFLQHADRRRALEDLRKAREDIEQARRRPVVGFHQRYRKGDLIASGGFADVFFAHDRELQRKVALKQNATRETRPSVEHERLILSQVTHPGIVSLYDSSADTAHVYLVLSLEADSLFDRLQEGPLPPEQLLAAAEHVANALVYMHEHGVVHSDLKPHNLLFAMHAHSLKVVDFSAAVLCPAGGVARCHAMTFDYAPPEQRERHEVSAASDVYSFASALVEGLTGNVPQPGGVGVRASLAALVGVDVAELLSSCLAVEPGHRPTDQAVASAIATWNDAYRAHGFGGEAPTLPPPAPGDLVETLQPEREEEVT
jgi:hypothetical protein